MSDIAFQMPHHAQEKLRTPQIVKKNVLFLFNRAHQNDLENIPFFILMATVYMVVAKPTIFTAKLVLYGFTAAR